MSTRTDLVVRVLDLLGITQEGQDSSAEDRQKVESFIDKTAAILKDEKVAIVDPSNVSDGAFEQFSTVLANMVAPAFGQPRDRDTINADKDALRIAQAAEGGAFSRRRMDWTPGMQRDLSANGGFSGTVARTLQNSSGSVGNVERQLQASNTFSGTVERALVGSK